MSEKQTNAKKKKWNQRGFYIALSVCLVAAGVAAWTTYSGITSQLREANQSPSVQNSAAQVGRAVSGVQESRVESAGTSQPESQAPSSQSSHTPSQSSRVTSSASSSGNRAPASSAPAQSAAPTQAAVNPTVFTYPLAKDVTKAYSGDRLVYSQTMQDWRVHEGLDLRAKTGDAVMAIAEGTVKDIYEDAMLGNVIVISHGSVEASYCGLGNTPLVKKGAAVKAGQKIGSVGVVPMELTEETHLHLQLKRDGVLIDPEELLTESGKAVS